MTIKPVVEHGPQPIDGSGNSNSDNNGGPNDNNGGGPSGSGAGLGGIVNSNNAILDAVGGGGVVGLGGSASAVGMLSDAIVGSGSGIGGSGMSPRAHHADHSLGGGVGGAGNNSSGGGGPHRRRRHNKRSGPAGLVAGGGALAVGGNVGGGGIGGGSGSIAGAGAGVGAGGNKSPSALASSNYQLVLEHSAAGGSGAGNVAAGSSHSASNAVGSDLMLASGSKPSHLHHHYLMHHRQQHHHLQHHGGGNNSTSSSSSSSNSSGMGSCTSAVAAASLSHGNADSSSSSSGGGGGDGSLAGSSRRGGGVGAPRRHRNTNEEEDETYAGYNSGDEHIGPKDGAGAVTLAEWQDRDQRFVKAMGEMRGFVVSEIGEDGACLFRSISLQLYGDQDMHEVIRQQTMDYIYKNREYFAQFVTEDIDSYVMRKRNNHVHGNHIEIQAISEMFNRPVELYCYQTEPINIFNSDQLKNGYEPLRLSYQRGSHYNAVLNPYKASVGVGLGLAGYSPTRPEQRMQLREAVQLSENLAIEQTMFEDKLKTTDWEATNSAIEEQIARESYMEWCRDNMQRMSASAAAAAAAAVGSGVTAAGVAAAAAGLEGGKSTGNRGSDDDSLEDGASFGSDSELKFDHASPPSSYGSSNHYAQQPPQQRSAPNERRRKRRRGHGHNSNNAAAAAAAATTPASRASDIAGPSVHAGSMTPPKVGRFEEASNASKTTTPSHPNSTSMDDLPGTSRQAVASTSSSSSPPSSSSSSSLSSSIAGTAAAAGGAAVSSFYHELLEASYSDEFADVNGRQLSEEQMLQKALQMSRLEFMHKQFGGDGGGSTP